GGAERWGKPGALDQGGWGGSVARDGRYDLGAMADDAEAVVRALGLHRYVLVGHSMGGKVAQIVAARQPKELVGMVLIAPAPPTPMPVPDTVRAGMLQQYSSRTGVLEALTVLGGVPARHARVQSSDRWTFRARQSAPMARLPTRTTRGTPGS